MLLCGGRRFNILAPTAPFSFGTFIKHLVASKSLKLSPSAKSFTASASSKVFSSSRFEALNSRQKEQVRIYIDSLLEWNQVRHSPFVFYLYVSVTKFYVLRWRVLLAENESDSGKGGERGHGKARWRLAFNYRTN